MANWSAGITRDELQFRISGSDRELLDLKKSLNFTNSQLKEQREMHSDDIIRARLILQIVGVDDAAINAQLSFVTGLQKTLPEIPLETLIKASSAIQGKQAADIALQLVEDSIITRIERKERSVMGKEIQTETFHNPDLLHGRSSDAYRDAVDVREIEVEVERTIYEDVTIRDISQAQNILENPIELKDLLINQIHRDGN